MILDDIKEEDKRPGWGCKTYTHGEFRRLWSEQLRRPGITGDAFRAVHMAEARELAARVEPADVAPEDQAKADAVAEFVKWAIVDEAERETEP